MMRENKISITARCRSHRSLYDNGHLRDRGRDQPIGRSRNRPRCEFLITALRMTSVSLSLMPPVVTRRRQRGRRVGGPRAGAPARRDVDIMPSFPCLVSARPLAPFHLLANGKSRPSPVDTMFAISRLSRDAIFQRAK